MRLHKRLLNNKWSLNMLFCHFRRFQFGDIDMSFVENVKETNII